MPKRKKPKSIGALRKSGYKVVGIREVNRQKLIKKSNKDEELFHCLI